MKKQKLLTDVISNIVGRMSFPIEYKAVTSTSTTVLLTGICDIRHVQPNKVITINAVNYRVTSYEQVGSLFNILLSKTSSQPAPPDSGTFDLYTPKFFHGTPMQQEVELGHIKNQQLKTPMIYLMEPYKSRIDGSWESSIYSRTPVTLCFLAEADIQRLKTDELQYNAVKPMYNLCQDFVAQLIESRMFYTDELDYSITAHSKFGINIRDAGTKQTLFTENLSGVTLDIGLDLYTDQACCQDQNFLLTSQGMYLQVD
jgi:hypothetical protein